ncbi:MAG: hypothetical protein JXQ23_07555 [Clostridia bacterium]|nr:hypothetical protein [Clostridia bacterium]
MNEYKKDYKISEHLEEKTKSAMRKIRRKSHFKKFLKSFCIILSILIIIVAAINFIPSVNSIVNDSPFFSAFLLKGNNNVTAGIDPDDKVIEGLIVKDGDETIDYIENQAVNYVVIQDNNSIYESTTDDFYNTVDKDLAPGEYEVVVRSLDDNGEGQVLSMFSLVIDSAEYMRNNVLFFRGTKKLDLGYDYDEAADLKGYYSKINICIVDDSGKRIDLRDGMFTISNGTRTLEVDKSIGHAAESPRGKVFTASFENDYLSIYLEENQMITFILAVDSQEYGFLINEKINDSDISEGDILYREYKLVDLQRSVIAIDENALAEGSVDYVLKAYVSGMNLGIDFVGGITGAFSSSPYKTICSNKESVSLYVNFFNSNNVYVYNEPELKLDGNIVNITKSGMTDNMKSICLSDNLHDFKYYEILFSGSTMELKGTLDDSLSLNLFTNSAHVNAYLLFDKFEQSMQESSISTIPIKDKMIIGKNIYINEITAFDTIDNKTGLSFRMIDEDLNPMKYYNSKIDNIKTDNTYDFIFKIIKDGKSVHEQVIDSSDDTLDAVMTQGIYQVEVSPVKQNDLFNVTSYFTLDYNPLKSIKYKFTFVRNSIGIANKDYVSPVTSTSSSSTGQPASVPPAVSLSPSMPVENESVDPFTYNRSADVLCRIAISLKDTENSNMLLENFKYTFQAGNENISINSNDGSKHGYSLNTHFKTQSIGDYILLDIVSYFDDDMKYLLSYDSQEYGIFIQNTISNADIKSKKDISQELNLTDCLSSKIELTGHLDNGGKCEYYLLPSVDFLDVPRDIDEGHRGTFDNSFSKQFYTNVSACNLAMNYCFNEYVMVNKLFDVNMDSKYIEFTLQNDNYKKTVLTFSQDLDEFNFYLLQLYTKTINFEVWHEVPESRTISVFTCDDKDTIYLNLSSQYGDIYNGSIHIIQVNRTKSVGYNGHIEKIYSRQLKEGFSIEPYIVDDNQNEYKYIGFDVKYNVNITIKKGTEIVYQQAKCNPYWFYAKFDLDDGEYEFVIEPVNEQPLFSGMSFFKLIINKNNSIPFTFEFTRYE